MGFCIYQCCEFHNDMKLPGSTFKTMWVQQLLVCKPQVSQECSIFFTWLLRFSDIPHNAPMHDRFWPLNLLEGIDCKVAEHLIFSCLFFTWQALKDFKNQPGKVTTYRQISQSSFEKLWAVKSSAQWSTGMWDQPGSPGLRPYKANLWEEAGGIFYGAGKRLSVMPASSRVWVFSCFICFWAGHSSTVSRGVAWRWEDGIIPGNGGRTHQHTCHNSGNACCICEPINPHWACKVKYLKTK